MSLLSDYLHLLHHLANVVPLGAAREISVKAAPSNVSMEVKMGSRTFLFPNGEKYVLILDLCNNIIAMEIIRLHLEEDFPRWTHSSAGKGGRIHKCHLLLLYSFTQAVFFFLKQQINKKKGRSSMFCAW